MISFYTYLEDKGVNPSSFSDRQIDLVHDYARTVQGRQNITFLVKDIKALNTMKEIVVKLLDEDCGLRADLNFLHTMIILWKGELDRQLKAEVESV